jgi:DNA-binding NtrC family response regulator
MFAASSILIIDDEAFLRRSLTLILQSKGYLVNSAASAQAGLQMLQAGSYDLVFLDIRLPDRSGMVVLPAIRQLYPDLPVLILTAHATMETAIEAVRQGARDYLLKPIDPEQILVRIREVLEEQSQPKRRREIAGQISRSWQNCTRSKPRMIHPLLFCQRCLPPTRGVICSAVG